MLGVRASLHRPGGHRPTTRGATMRLQDKFGKLSLMKGFVFKRVFGERPDLCKKLVEVTLGIEVEGIEVVHPEREIEVIADRAGGRLDLYVVDAQGNRYDIEVQATNRSDEVLSARRYQALMDANQLRKGHEEKELRYSWVVFICDFDIFGMGLKRYDTGTACFQTGERVDDRRVSTYLNVRGEGGEEDPALDRLLRLFAGEDDEDDAFVRGILEEMEKCRDNPEWMERFMTFEEEKERYAASVAEKATKEAKEELLRICCGFVEDGILGVEEAAERFGVSVEEIRSRLESER